MAAAGYIVEAVFDPLGLIPTTREVKALNPHISLNVDTYLDIVAIVLTAVLLLRFFRSGGGPMLRMMGGSPDGDHQMGNEAHDHHGHVATDP
jgi:hypothetical protein